MSRQPVVLLKQAPLRAAEDFFRLRREGIGFIEQLGSRWWTDYNAHDPGITILDQLCYAITDLAYRIGWDIKDLLAPATPSPNPAQPYPHQAFFTARNILTVNPVTPDDFRRLLIDLERVRNAWVFCKSCGCDLPYYAWCENDELHLSYRKPTNPALTPQTVEPLGLYEIRVELEADPDLGDLNDRKIEHTYTVFDDEGQPQLVAVELHFPEWGLEKGAEWNLFLASEDAFAGQNGESISLKLLKFNRSNNPADQSPLTDDALRRNWNNLFYATYELELLPGGQKLTIANVTLRLFGSMAAKNLTTVLPGGAPGTVSLQQLLINATDTGPLPRYRRKQLRVEAAVQTAKAALHQHRNLGEDYCRVSRVDVEDVAVCADVEVRPDADIERIQAHIWFEIERYFNPPVPFYSLPELLAEGVSVEEIFNGPELNKGFIKADELAAAGLKSVLRVSDLINRLMDIEGVVAVNNLLLSKYDAAGNQLKGAADPIWTNGLPVFDTTKASAAWLLFVSNQHQPRLHFHLSRFLFYKNGLPFLPRRAEALATLTQLRGEAERAKVAHAPTDLAVPTGTFRDPEADYSPLQNSFPRTYGIGPEGLPSAASPRRRAQAKQLKAYLLAFEQLLGNAFAQVAHTTDMFSLDPAISQTYFSRQFSDAVLGGYSELVNGLTPAVLGNLTETLAEFLERRNRFLDHLLARFGESFKDYALLLTSLEGQQVSQQQLIADKIAFLEAYPLISHDRGRAFNYAENPADPANVSGLKHRVGLLLGFAPGSDLDRFIVVEHLLLRPKFPGDALYPACSDGACGTCGDEDPYSFRLTFVMAGWAPPFSENLDLRGFADRTVRQETPAHLLAKICWVGNDGFIENPCDPVVGELADLLEAKGLTADNLRPASAEACACALAIYTAFSTVFTAWYEDKTLTYVQSDALLAALEQEFTTQITPTELSCTTVLNAALWAEVMPMLVKYFHHIALYGWQFERFEDAWRAWLTANAAHDWPAERLQERVEAILRSNLLTAPPTVNVEDELCHRATAVLTQFGLNFYDWLEANLTAGRTLNNLTAFAPQPVVLAPGLSFKPGTVAALETLLKARYATYVEVSYRLRMVVNLLGKLRNTYPGATLHDCDDGSDQNPVRLGSTALGNYPLRRQITPMPSPAARTKKAVLTPSESPVSPEVPLAAEPLATPEAAASSETTAAPEDAADAADSSKRPESAESVAASENLSTTESPDSGESQSPLKKPAAPKKPGKPRRPRKS
ncbi:hypothetical protein [Hymenobacter negativus]|uniref:Insecticidal toxin complex protein n=1 Tax=Hymenobacter negativus TaxID=2795026 RepID=A0ABS3QK71_9BACT|nr:hypothetical protein [Hymenobacter negativus]MBO2011557.1 hypothetical protein [Hymenobacter negativus]